MRPRFQTLRVAFVAALLLSGLPAYGQMLGVKFEAQAQMTTEAGNVTGCGMSFSAAYVDGSYIQGLSGSINLYLMGAVAVKAGLFDFAATGNPQSPVKQTPSPFRLSWARPGNGKAVSAQKPEHVFQGDGPGFLMFAVPMEVGSDLIARVANGDKLWLGFRSKEGRERVFSGPVEWQADGHAQFVECLNALSRAAAEKQVGGQK